MDAPRTRIVLGYDGSADADVGLGWALAHAARRGLPVHVVAATGDLVYLPERSSQAATALAQSWVATAGERLEAASVAWTSEVSAEEIVPVLLRASEEAALVVLGARGHGVIGGLFLGSVSQHVSRHAHCPVVVARGPLRADSDSVVVGVDGSPGGHRALEWTFAHAEVTGSTVVAVHGYRPPPLLGPYDLAVAADAALDQETADRILAESLAGFKEQHPGVVVIRRALPLPPARAVVDASQHASLAVVGSRGRGGFAELMLGSVSSGVLHHAACPVAVVR